MANEQQKGTVVRQSQQGAGVEKEASAVRSGEDARALAREIAFSEACRVVRLFLVGKAGLGSVCYALSAVPEEELELVAMATRQPVARLAKLRARMDQLVT